MPRGLIRPATEEEVKRIEKESDLGPGTTVIALDTPAGVALAVKRIAVEIDPVFFPEGLNTRGRALFIRDLETGLIWEGITVYYFNVDATNQGWRDTVEAYGAEQVSKGPEIRYRKSLVDIVDNESEK